MRLIDADALNPKFVHGRWDDRYVSEKEVQDAPTVDAVERKKGNWVGIDDEPCETFECDRCGFVLEDWIQGAFYNFCPNCGADMRGEANKDD